MEHCTFLSNALLTYHSGPESQQETCYSRLAKSSPFLQIQTRAPSFGTPALSPLPLSWGPTFPQTSPFWPFTL